MLTTRCSLQCCAFVDSIYLPGYTRCAPPRTIVAPAEQRCYCNMTTKEMFDRDGEQLQRAGEIEIDSNVEALCLGADRQDKTPAVSEIQRWRTGGRREGDLFE